MRTASSVCSHLQDVNVAYRIFENSIVAIPNILGRPEILRISGLATQWRSPEKNTWHLIASALAVNGENIFRQNGSSASLVK